MTHKSIIILILGFSIQVNAQISNRFSDKVNMKKFIKEYLKIDKNNIENKSLVTNIQDVIEKYVIKYRIDTNVNDTLFILETCGFETRNCFGSLWNTNKQIDFVIPHRRKIKFLGHEVFKAKERLAISQWDKSIFNSLNEEGKLWINPDWHFATRVIIGNSIISVEREAYLH
jgi:hypothetical protein